MASPTSRATWRTAIDDLAIRNLVARLAQAADDRDETSYRACLAQTVSTNVEGKLLQISADDYAHAAIARLARTDWTHHILMNPVICVDQSELHASASIDVVVEIARVEVTAGRLRETKGGRYSLEFISQDGVWQITRRTVRWRYSDVKRCL
ncbi:nuclear transport factor 2 family protein [Microvirga rosea]|uniref:nuclear transport factor 2 family protein n=1 Tax=Microvirga rosea TaxID=2715425 RepID=UPI001D0AF7DC|nr:nuclear transport factor 2 family protein [Microvirga rosea]MCB8823344.1 nuclear transport factor 2 family protein [Microvirga rosea]